MAVPSRNVVEIITGDPAMTAKILQVVNSAFFGVPSEVVSPLAAVRLLGFDLVSSLALSVGSVSQVTDRWFETLAEQWWRHSLTTASFAKVIAQAENAEARMVDTAMTAGLLHDVGKLVLVSCLGDDYLKLLRDAQNRLEPLWQLEQDTYGTSHAEVGAYLLALWALPDPIVEAVAYHHRPREMAEPPVSLTAVHVANGVAHQYAGRSASPADQEYLEQCGLDGRYADWEQACHAAAERDGHEHE